MQLSLPGLHKVDCFEEQGSETERMHTISRRLGSRQILWLLYDFLRPHVTGDSTFKLVDLVKTTIDRFTHGTEQERLEAFTNRWDHVLAGISVDRPEDSIPLKHERRRSCAR